MSSKLAQLLGPHRRVPTLADDSGILHAIMYAVNAAYRNASLADRCRIVQRFRRKLARAFEQKYTHLADCHADTFAMQLRDYSGRVGMGALELVEHVLRVDIGLWHAQRETFLRPPLGHYTETIVLSWDENWGVLEFIRAGIRSCIARLNAPIRSI